jgi:hypothetical protein
MFGIHYFQLDTRDIEFRGKDKDLRIKLGTL